jgi:hypothetical protein
MPLETQTLPGTITRGEQGDAIASGWCLVAFDSVGLHAPLPEWRGEIALDADGLAAVTQGGDLYIRFHPYGGIYEPWHGPITVEPVDVEDDPNQRRVRLLSNGPLVRSRYTPEELRHGFPKPEAEPTPR